MTANLIGQRAKSWVNFTHSWQRAILLAITAALILLPVLLSPTFLTGSDVSFHIYNAQDFIHEIQSGTLYPRWLGDWYGGYGAPIGVAYPPFTYYMVFVVAAVGLPTLIAFKVVMWLSVFVSGLAMVELSRKFMPLEGALLAGVLYQVLPYHVFDLYGRTALAEYMAFLWVPVAFLLTFTCIRKGRIRDTVGMALVIGGLLLTHLLTAYLLAPLLGIFAAYLLWRTPEKRIRRGVFWVSAAVLGALLAATYWLPALLENQYTNTAWFEGASGWGNYLNNFLFNAQVYLGTELESAYRVNVEIGIGAILCLIIGISALVINRLTWQRRTQVAREMSLVMTIILGISLFMSFSVSRPLWAILPRSDVIQFPWRWQTIAALAAAYLGGDVFVWVWQKLWETPLRKNLIPVTILVGVLLLNLVYSGIIIRWHHDMLTDDQAAQFLGKAPLSTDYYSWVYDNPYLTKWSADFDYSAAPVSEQTRVVSDSAVNVNIEQWDSQARVFTVSAPSDAVLNVRTFWFPGWQVEINNQAVIPDIVPADGTMAFPIASGESRVTLNFVDTPVRSAGTLISIAAALILGGLSVFGFIRRNRKDIQAHAG